MVRFSGPALEVERGPVVLESGRGGGAHGLEERVRPGGAGQHRLEALVAERLAARVGRLGQAVGDEDEPLARADDARRLLVRDLGPHAERKARTRHGQRTRRAVADAIRIRKAGVAESEAPRVRLVTDVREGDELPPLEMGHKAAVGLAERLGDRTVRGEEREDRLDGRHDEARAHPLARDVGDDDSERAVRQAEDVVEVAGDEPRGEVARDDAVAVARELWRWKDALLDRARDLELLLGELGLLEALDGAPQPVLQDAEAVEEEADQERDRPGRRQVAADAAERELEVHEAGDAG